VRVGQGTFRSNESGSDRGLALAYTHRFKIVKRFFDLIVGEKAAVSENMPALTIQDRLRVDLRGDCPACHGSGDSLL